ncbi:hypothetical protein V8B97DRAFT_1913654 [Scleroderma yunnanense]
MALLKLLFSVHHYNLVRSISGLPPNRPRNLEDTKAGFIRVLRSGLLPEENIDEESLEEVTPNSPAEPIVQLKADDPRALEFRGCLRVWFRRATWSSIKRQDAYSYLHWVFYDRTMPPLESLPEYHRNLLDEALLNVEKRVGKVFLDEPSVGAQPIRLTIDEVNVQWRSLTWYIMVLNANWFLKHWLIRSHGAQFGCYNGLDYFVCIPPSWDLVHGPCPIVFLHGLGLGLLQYKLVFYNLLRNHSDRPLLVPLQPHISQNIFHPNFLEPMPRDRMTACLVGLLREFGWVSSLDDDSASGSEKKSKHGVVLLSHSYGSFVHAWFLKAYPHLAVRSCLVDPVAVCCWEGVDVLRYDGIVMAALYLMPLFCQGLDLLMRYFVGTELGVANTLQRHFDWTSNSLWFEDIPNARDHDKTLIVLGGKDAILNAERVRRYLTSHGVCKGLYYDPDASHGQTLAGDGRGHDTITKWLQQE